MASRSSVRHTLAQSLVMCVGEVAEANGVQNSVTYWYGAGGDVIV